MFCLLFWKKSQSNELNSEFLHGHFSCKEMSWSSQRQFLQQIANSADVSLHISKYAINDFKRYLLFVMLIQDLNHFLKINILSVSRKHYFEAEFMILSLRRSGHQQLFLEFTEQKMKFSINDFFSNVTKSAVFRGFGHLLKNSLMENFFLCAVITASSFEKPVLKVPEILKKI